MTNFTPQVKRVGKSDKDQLKLAFALAKEKRYDEALSEFQTIIQGNPASKFAHMGAGSVLFRQELYDEALLHFQTAIRLDSLLTKAHIGAGQVYLRQRKLEQALEKFQTALSVDPNCPEAYQGLGQVLSKQEKYDEAIQNWRQAQRLNPQMISVRLLMSQIYHKQEKLPQALGELKSALNIDPTRWRTYYGVGRIYLQQKEYIAAIEAFETALKLNPETPPFAQLGLVEALIEVNKLDDAADILRHMPQNKRVDARIHQLWGDIYQRQGLLKEATEEYRAATLLAAEEGTTLDELAEFDALLDEERWQDVVAPLQAAANQRVAEAQERQRENFQKTRFAR